MKTRFTRSLLLIWFAAAAAVAQTSAGPERGSLVLTGGEFGKGVIERFVALAGGADANFVYVPTAASSLRLPSGFIYDRQTLTSPPQTRKRLHWSWRSFSG